MGNPAAYLAGDESAGGRVSIWLLTEFISHDDRVIRDSALIALM